LTPWETDKEQMTKKTPWRRLAKRMPVSVVDKRNPGALLRAAIIDEYGDRGLLVATERGFEVAEEAKPSEPPIEVSEDLSGKLKESIEAAEKNKPGREKKKPKQEPAKPTKAPGPPKAAIPPEDAPSKINDPYISPKEQTDLCHTAMEAGWRVPEELNKFLQDHFAVRTFREIRQSQLPKILVKVKSGT
jgi:hypothetical protein